MASTGSVTTRRARHKAPSSASTPTPRATRGTTTETAATTSVTSIAMDSAGDFIMLGKARTRTAAAMVCMPSDSSPPKAARRKAIGSEFRVNTYTTSAQNLSAIASDAAGDYIIVWDSTGKDGAS